MLRVGKWNSRFSWTTREDPDPKLESSSFLFPLFHSPFFVQPVFRDDGESFQEVIGTVKPVIVHLVV